MEKPIARIEEERVLSLPVSRGRVDAVLSLPGEASSTVIFANGGNSHLSGVQNCRIARILKKRGISTLRVNLLTPEEEAIDRKAHHVRFNIGLLSRRLQEVTDWAVRHIPGRNTGYFGSGTGAAAALAAASRRSDISALVCGNGRPDLADTALRRLRTPVLFIVGDGDFPLIDIHRDILRDASPLNRLVFIRGARRYFKKAAEIREAARITGEWFSWYLEEMHTAALSADELALAIGT